MAFGSPAPSVPISLSSFASFTGQVFLHAQERFLERLGGRSGRGWAKHFYLPTAADLYVIAFRKWLEKHGGGDPQWAPGVDTALPPMEHAVEALMDRYQSHTKNCLACMTALAGVRKVRELLLWAAGAAGLLAAACLGTLASVFAVGGTSAAAVGATRGAAWVPAAAGAGLPLLTAVALAALVAWKALAGTEKAFLVGRYPPPRNRIKGVPELVI